MSYCCACMWKTFPALFYIICGSASGWSFAPIILLHVSLCPMNFCSSRKLPNKVPSSARHCRSIQNSFSKTLEQRNYFVCSANASLEDLASFPRMCNLTYFADTANNVWNFLGRTKLVSSYIKEIYIYRWVTPFLNNKIFWKLTIFLLSFEVTWLFVYFCVFPW